MGFITQVILHNDALHCFEDYPKEFAEAVLAAVNTAYHENKQVSVPFKGYCNYIAVETPRHADHSCLFLASGNGFIALGERDWRDLGERNPTLAREYLRLSKTLLKRAEEELRK